MIEIKNYKLVCPKDINSNNPNIKTIIDLLTQIIINPNNANQLISVYEKNQNQNPNPDKNNYLIANITLEYIEKTFIYSHPLIRRIFENIINLKKSNKKIFNSEDILNLLKNSIEFEINEKRIELEDKDLTELINLKNKSKDFIEISASEKLMAIKYSKQTALNKIKEIKKFEKNLHDKEMKKVSYEQIIETETKTKKDEETIKEIEIEIKQAKKELSDAKNIAIIALENYFDKLTNDELLNKKFANKEYINQALTNIKRKRKL